MNASSARLPIPLQGKAQDVKQHRWFEGFDWESLAARKIAAPRKPREDAAKRIRELVVGFCRVLHVLYIRHTLVAHRSRLAVQETERKQRAPPKETPEEIAEAEAVFADF